MYRSLHVWLEGADDERFFDRVLRPELSKKYKIRTNMYAAQSKRASESLIKTLNHSSTDYIIFSDLDLVQCITKRKEQLGKKISGVDLKKIAVVKREIESWYLAGLDRHNASKLGIMFYPNTDWISKEQFESSIPSRFSRIEFMQEILDRFDIQVAMKQNYSFRYVWHKFVL